jgi:ATP adenylyltransferase
MEKPLWAPWRMEFIGAPKPAGCIFCDFPKEEGREAERKNLLAHRSGHSFTLLNRFPYNSGHVLVIPQGHLASLDSLSAEAFADLNEELRRAVAVLRKVYRPDGFNIGMNLGQMAGAGIADHLHYHVVPRWGGDTNFMPIVAETKVIIEHLDSAWERIRNGFGD